MSTRKITTSISTPSLSSYDVTNFKNDKISYSENNTLKNSRGSLKMDTLSSLKFYTATQKSNKNKLFEVINNKDLRSAFYDFLGTQFCVENLLCWEAIEKFKQMNGSPSEMYSTAEEIYSLFIRDNSRFEINIYGKQKDRLKETLKHTFIIPEFQDSNSNGGGSSNGGNSPTSIIGGAGTGLSQSISNLNLNTSFSGASSGGGSMNPYNSNIVQSSTFITNAPIQSDTFPKRKRKLRFRKLISKSNLSNIFSDPSTNSSKNISNNNNIVSPQVHAEIIHPPLSPSNTMNFDPDFKNNINNSSSGNNSNNCTVGSCSDDSFVVIFGNTISNRKSGSAYLSGSDSSDSEYEEFDRNNIKFGIAKCSNLFNDIQDELEQMMIENSLGEFTKSKIFKEKSANTNNDLKQQQTQTTTTTTTSKPILINSNSNNSNNKSNNNDNLNIAN